MKKYIVGIGIGTLILAQTAFAAPVAGCYQLNPPGEWAELLLNGQNGAVGNEISAWDDRTYNFSGAKLAEVQTDASGEWDYLTKYAGGTLVLSNIVGAQWFSPCGPADATVIAFTEVLVKTRSTRFTNDPGRLEFELSAQSGAYSILATYAGTPVLVQVDSNYVASAALTSAQICVGERVRMNVVQSSLNVKSRGVMPVVLYGSADFNVDNLDLASIKLECTAALRSKITDVNQDGHKDVLLKFSTPAVAPGLMDVPDKTSTTLVLTAAMKDGTPISALDSVRILNKGKPAKTTRTAKASSRGKAVGRK